MRGNRKELRLQLIQLLQLLVRRFETLRQTLYLFTLFYFLGDTTNKKNAEPDSSHKKKTVCNQLAVRGGNSKTRYRYDAHPTSKEFGKDDFRVEHVKTTEVMLMKIPCPR